MISPGTAALAVSIAKGLIKLGGRFDRLMAEKEAATGALVLPMPTVTGGMDDVQKGDALRKFLKVASKASPDPLGDGRAEIERALEDQAAVTDAADFKRVSNQINSLFEQYLPEKAFASVINPDAEYLTRLKEFYPSVNLDDPETRLAAFYLRSGKQDGSIGYAGRVALLIVDVLAEFGAENTSLFIRDEKVQSLLAAVLKRFSKPQLENYNRWSPLLRHAMSATLNGVLDARHVYQGDDKWLNALLDALEEARSDPSGGDNYLLGLFQSKGYRLLIGKGLSETAQRLGEAEADEFQTIAANALKAAAPLVKANKKGFGGFFKDHWGHLLGAGLKSVEKYGPTLLAGQPELLKETLLVVIEQLAVTSGKERLTSETLFHIVDAAIGVVAAKPALITGGIQEEWLKKLIESVTKTAGDLKMRKVFSREGLETVIKDAAGRFAEHPELIVKKHDVFQVVVGGILSKISGLDRISAKNIASAAVGAALRGIADNPALLDTKYAEVIAGFAGKLSALVAAKSLTGIQARDIMTAATAAMLENPILFTELGDKISGAIISAAVGAAEKSDPRQLAGATILKIVEEMFAVFAKKGKRFAELNNANQLKKKLMETIGAALVRAEKEVGNQITVTELPGIIGLLVSALVQGELPTTNPADPNFKRLFSQFAQQVTAGTAN